MSDRVETTTPSSSGSESGSAELTAVVDELLNQLSTKFQGISKELLEKSKCPAFSTLFFRLDRVRLVASTEKHSTSGSTSSLVDQAEYHSP
ncbi:hypothetical protein HDK90DRAFT_490101 [Phyllosticta capitalensis]|uniref:Uncharacterized protein n=1 Tax=Phyllosticta capitalensis TaxID=121624 RepID=A0ABR1YKX0_9PEZI